VKYPKFHWALPVDPLIKSSQDRDVTGQVDIKKLREFAQAADKTVITSLLTPFGFHMPDPIPLLGMLAACTDRVGFLLAYRTGSISPVLFTQQVNTLSQLLGDRLALNFVAGISPAEQAGYGDFLKHDERYLRADEFIDICTKIWTSHDTFDYQGRFYKLAATKLHTRFIGRNVRPKVYISGNSKKAQEQALRVGDCWLRYGDTPENLQLDIPDSFRTENVGAGLRISIIARQTRKEALDAAQAIVKDMDPHWKSFIKDFIEQSDSQAVKQTYKLSQVANEQWLNEDLWTGIVPFRGGPAIAIVGDYAQVAQAISKFIRVGIREFILSGWPSLEELIRFDQYVYPLIAAEMDQTNA
jgi:alkanesulfonate monooxygenase